MIFPNKILPFVDYAPIMKVEINKTISTDKLFYTGGSLLNDKPTVYNILGTSIFFTDTKVEGNTVIADVYTVDYRIVLNRMDFKGNVALYPTGEGLYSCLDCFGLSAINSLMSGITSLEDYEKEELPYISECIHTNKDKLNEAIEGLVDLSGKQASVGDIKKATGTFRDMFQSMTLLDSYLGIEGANKGVELKAMPMLYGLPGIGKTALIKSLVSKTKGRYRIEEVCVPAINLLDLNGLIEDKYITTDSDDAPIQGVTFLDKNSDKVIPSSKDYVDINQDVVYAEEDYIDPDDKEALRNWNKKYKAAFNYAFCDFIYKCSDEYIMFCEQGYNDLLDLKTRGKISKKDLPAAIEALEKLAEYKKPPILFLDEFNMASPGVHNAMMTIFSDHTFGNLHFKQAKVVGASNEIIDNSDPQDASRLNKKVLGTAPPSDTAHLRRLTRIYISPIEFFPLWQEWALSSSGNGLYNINPALWNIIFPDKGNNRFFDLATLKNNVNTSGTGDIGPQYHSISNPRGWTMLSDILYKIRPNGEDYLVKKASTVNLTYSVESNPANNPTEISESLIKRLLGENSLSWVQSDSVFNSYFKLVPQKENVSDLQQAANDGVDYMVNTLLLGGASIGKSFRIQQKAAEDENLSILSVDVSAVQPSELNGALRIRPVVADFDRAYAENFISASKEGKNTKNIKGGFISQVLEKSIETLSNDKTIDFHLPTSYTQRTPLAKLQKIIDRINKSPKEKCILFFDEVTRYTSYPVIGAVQLAMTARKLYGCDIPADKFVIMCAGNVGKGYQANSLFLPFILRCLLCVHTQYTETEVKEYIKHMETAKDKKGNPVYLEASVEFVKDLLAKGEAVEFFSNFETKRGSDVAPTGLSSGAFDGLNNSIKNSILYNRSYEKVFTSDTDEIMKNFLKNVLDANGGIKVDYLESSEFDVAFEHIITSYKNSNYIIPSKGKQALFYESTIESLRNNENLANTIAITENFKKFETVYNKEGRLDDINDKIAFCNTFRLARVYELMCEEVQLSYLEQMMGYAGRYAKRYLKCINNVKITLGSLLNLDSLKKITSYYKLNFIKQDKKLADMLDFYTSSNPAKGIFAFCQEPENQGRYKVTPKDMVNFLVATCLFFNGDSRKAASGGKAAFEEFLVSLLQHCKAEYNKVTDLGITKVIQSLGNITDKLPANQLDRLKTIVPGQNLEDFFEVMRITKRG